MGMGKQIKLETDCKQKWKWLLEVVIKPVSSAPFQEGR